jgi:hypothetical protein
MNYAINVLLYNILVRLGYNVFCQIVGIPMGTNCALLTADLFLFRYEFQIIPPKRLF